MTTTHEPTLRHLIADNVRWLREQRRMSQVDLASYAGVSRSTVQEIEGAVVNSYLSTLSKIAHALNVPFHRLLEAR